ncbi:barstar family protein [Streptomyces sp. B21-083]|uniref:barstar family protein n=1 Tax=Streptomyces sp. B21-083 TaxID=3039410 RepID=UPI002FF2B669
MTATTAWIRRLTDAAPANIPTACREVRGSRCRTVEGLFTEWAAGLDFPDYFGHNWDAFHDCLRDTVPSAGIMPAGPEAPPTAAIVLREAGDLLADEEERALGVLLLILNQVADSGSTGPRLLLLLDDTSEQLVSLARRLADVGYPPAFADKHP